MKHRILARLEHMAAEDVLAMVPKDTIERLKKSDPSPEFRVYVVGHEGVAHPSMISFGQRVQMAVKYMGDVVMGISNKLIFGTPIFPGHAAANTGGVREQIGELVGKAVRNIEGKVQALAAVYLYPKYRKLNLDVASIESEVEYHPTGTGTGDVMSVGTVSAIALGDSRMEKPAFPGATLQAVVHAFMHKGAVNHMAMTAGEIRAAIREAGVKPTEVFDEPELLEAPPIKQKLQQGHEHARRVEDQLGKERERITTLTRESEEKDKKIGALNTQVSSVRSRDMFGKEATNRKLNDQQKSFIERNLGSFNSPKEGAELEVEFAKFIDGQLKSFDDTAKLFGVKPAEGTPAGTPAADGKGGSSDTADMTDPKNNDLIPV